jgi:hypothetical protein
MSEQGMSWGVANLNVKKVEASIAEEQARLPQLEEEHRKAVYNSVTGDGPDGAEEQAHAALQRCRDRLAALGPALDHAKQVKADCEAYLAAQIYSEQIKVFEKRLTQRQEAIAEMDEHLRLACEAYVRADKMGSFAAEACPPGALGVLEQGMLDLGRLQDYWAMASFRHSAKIIAQDVTTGARLAPPGAHPINLGLINLPTMVKPITEQSAEIHAHLVGRLKGQPTTLSPQAQQAMANLNAPPPEPVIEEPAAEISDAEWIASMEAQRAANLGEEPDELEQRDEEGGAQEEAPQMTPSAVVAPAAVAADPLDTMSPFMRKRLAEMEANRG